MRLTRRDRVRVGADFNAEAGHSEVARIDFDTDGCERAIVVEFLSSQGRVIIDLIDTSIPEERYRVAGFDLTS